VVQLMMDVSMRCCVHRLRKHIVLALLQAVQLFVGHHFVATVQLRSTVTMTCFVRGSHFQGFGPIRA
jgi:hypothetical protein